LADICVKVAGKSISPIHENLAEGATSKYIAGRKRIPSELQVLIQSTERATHDTGWKPKTPLVEGIRKQWQWLLSHGERYSLDNMRV
jgi:nucleoside-diphosphate-sugar epimerase